MWIVTQVWEIISNKWVWVFAVAYFFFVQPIVKHFQEQDSRLARVERMLKELTGHMQ